MSKSHQHWYNPDPESLGEVVLESQTPDGRNKAVIIRNSRGNYTVHGYVLDDSDHLAGYSESLGWLSEFGPSITDSLERAKSLAEEYLARGGDESAEPTAAGDAS